MDEKWADRITKTLAVYIVVLLWATIVAVILGVYALADLVL